MFDRMGNARSIGVALGILMAPVPTCSEGDRDQKKDTMEVVDKTHEDVGTVLRDEKIFFEAKCPKVLPQR